MEILLTLLGFFSGGMLTALLLLGRVRVWRTRWIELEHDLARAEKREPRNIDKEYNNGK